MMEIVCSIRLIHFQSYEHQLPFILSNSRQLDVVNLLPMNSHGKAKQTLQTNYMTKSINFAVESKDFKGLQFGVYA